MPTADADQFLRVLFDQCQGVVVTCNAEEGFKARRWKPGKPLKGCVYYCISTVADTNPRDDVLPRQAQHLVLTYAVVLDDVGTKVSRETLKGKLAPTGKLRTSMPKGKSNEQWIYAFDEGVPPDRAAALIQALADAGLTDKGSRRADRIMRVPGSLNEKYDPPFAAELLEWHPDRLYTFSEVCVGLGVVPSDTAPLSAGPQALPDGMIDPIDSWNHDHDRVTGPMNPRGWYAITCPLESEHTGDVAHGCDYKPGLPGVFKCQHEHAGRPPLTTSWYRAWILEQDPAADLSIVPRAALEELGSKLAAALGVTPGPPPPAAPGLQATQPTLSEEAFKALQGALAAGGMFPTQAPPFDLRRAILDDLIHVASEDCYWSVETKCLLTHKAVDDRWFSLMLPSGMLDRFNDDGKKLAPMSVANWLKWQPDTQRVARIVHRLGEPLIVDDCLNIALAVPARLEVPGEPEPWLDLISFVCKDIKQDIEHVLDWMALMATDWSEKPGWHPMWLGEHGTGKNLAMRPLVKYMGPHCRNVSSSDIAHGFTSFLGARLIVVDELKMTSRGSSTPHDVYNNIKAWTARDHGTIWVNPKGRENYEVANRSGWSITSNEGVPLPLQEGDRRFMVIDTPRVPWPEEDYQEVVDWLVAGGDQMAVSWLHRRWDAMPTQRRKVLFGRAPMTEAKADLIDVSGEGIEGAIRMAIRGNHTTPWPDLMTLEDVMARLTAPDFSLLTEQMRKQVNVARATVALKVAGAEPVFKHAVRSGEKLARLWCMRASKMHGYRRLGAGAELFDIYVEQRSGKLPQGFMKVVKAVGNSE